jgi:hypothetical protein
MKLRQVLTLPFMDVALDGYLTGCSHHLVSRQLKRFSIVAITLRKDFALLQNIFILYRIVIASYSKRIILPEVGNVTAKM